MWMALRVRMGMGSCNACSSRLLPTPCRLAPPGSFIRGAEQSKLIQHRNLVDFFVLTLARPGSCCRGVWSRLAMEGVAEESFRHVLTNNALRLLTCAHDGRSRRSAIFFPPAREGGTRLTTARRFRFLLLFQARHSCAGVGDCRSKSRLGLGDERYLCNW
jgi:hypothetical protein